MMHNASKKGRCTATNCGCTTADTAPHTPVMRGKVVSPLAIYSPTAKPLVCTAKVEEQQTLIQRGGIATGNTMDRGNSKETLNNTASAY